MLKIYFDWNVLSQIKNGGFPEIKNFILNNEQIIYPFSTSHIGDIFASYKDNEEQLSIIHEDLDFITLITKNICLYNTGNDILIGEYAPQELFRQRIDSKDFIKNYSLNTLAQHLNENEFTKEYAESLIDIIKSIPIEESFMEAFKNPQCAEMMNNLLPGFKDNPTMEGFFESFMKTCINFNETESYKGLRQFTQNSLGINSNKISDSKEPFTMIEDIYKPYGGYKEPSNSDHKHSPKWFNDITKEYIFLDMYGFSQDSIKVNPEKGRKQTFRNTIEDASHAAFASTCNCYVVNDKKAYKKTKCVYEKLGVGTVVLNPSEFIKLLEDI